MIYVPYRETAWKSRNPLIHSSTLLFTFTGRVMIKYLNFAAYNKAGLLSESTPWPAIKPG